MKPTRPRWIGVFVFVLIAAGSAEAQSNRSFVATFGRDSNDCSQGKECRSFARAVAQTNAGGEVIAVDSGGFGTFSIDKSIIVIAPAGVNAAITATTGNAIIVNATGAKVVLRGLDVSALGGANGIRATNFGTLIIEKCVVNGFSEDGIQVFTSGTGETYVRDCVLRNNGADGILFSSGTQIAVVERTALLNNFEGLLTFGSVKLTGINRVGAEPRGLRLVEQ